VLLILTTTFFMMGFGLWSTADANMRRLESTFTTIGTVEQKPTSLQLDGLWDAEMKDYIYRKNPVTGKTVPLSVLDFPGANYIHKPEKRPFYCAYDHGYVIVTNLAVEGGIEKYINIVEIQPLSDFETGSPAPVRITKVLMGLSTMQGTTVLLCNHYEEKTYKLYADKTYIVALYDLSAHMDETVYFTEYTPLRSVPIYTDEEYPPWDEVTPGFYDTPKGKMWLNYINAENESERHTIPVLPTNYTKLLMAFYNGDARIIDGRDINEEEYKNGEHVCLVQRRFAEKNGLSVGSSLPLPLVWTGWYSSFYAFYLEGEAGTEGQLNESGEPLLTPFDNDTYKIVGIYDTAGASSDAYKLGGNAVIIPMASVDNIDKNDVRDGIPMKDVFAMEGSYTSFQIPNGTIDKFMAAWEAQGVDDLEITFYDKGYSKIKAGLDEMKSMAVLMFTVGGVTTLFTIVLFCHLFITKQRRRTAIERSLGLSKALCTLSLLISVLVIVVPAYICGGVLSNYLTGVTAPRINAAQSAQAFDTEFSDWVNTADNDIAVSKQVISQGGETGYLLAGAAVIPLSLLIAWGAVRGNLKEEPLKLLSQKEH
jgi:hypothetical protein